MIGSPVIIEHQDVTDKNADKIRCGVISDAYFYEPDGWYYAEGIIWDDKAISLINDGWSVSCSYDFLAFNDEGGEENNIKYDKEFTELNFTHLAIVNNPRYERANIVFNSKDEEKGKWVTIKGNHIFIPDGKTLDEVIEEKGWGSKKESKISKDIDDYDRKWQNEPAKWGKEPDQETQYRKEKWEEAVKKYEEIKKKNLDWDVQKQDTKDALAEERKAYKELEIARKNSGVLSKYETLDEQESKGKQFDTKDKQSGKEKSEPEWLQREKQKLDRQTTQMYEDRYSTEHPETYKKNVEKAKDKQSDTNEKHGFKKDKDSGYYMKDLPDGTSVYVEKKEGGQGEKEPFYLEATHFDKDGKPINKKQYHYDSMDDMFDKINKDFVSKDKKEQTLDDKIKEHENKIPKNYRRDNQTKALWLYKNDYITRSEWEKVRTNNSKEQDMILLDELKKLITKVENNKENEEMIDNEKVDKRKLIDEVGGILKGKVDDEIIRTIIKKMEEASYNDSEASADNKKVKNEDDEEKKIDNEEDEKEEVKNKKKVKNEDEEDEEKVEELKKEEKKDVENKCKNSKETSTFDKINAIYNSVRALKPQTKYTSRQEKLDNAVEYFKN